MSSTQEGKSVNEGEGNRLTESDSKWFLWPTGLSVTESVGGEKKDHVMGSLISVCFHLCYS